MIARGTILLPALVAMLLGCADSVVGGRCADGYERSGRRCVAATTDAGSPVDALQPVDGPYVPSDASERDGPVHACTGGLVSCDGTCVELDADMSHCGACDVACGEGQVCSGGMCAASCGPALTACSGSCFDANTSATNCGGCGVVCRSGICNAGACRDARAGHLVLLGHDYSQTRSDQERILANAVFLVGIGPARVLAYEAFAATQPGGAVQQANAAIDRGSGSRPWSRTVLAAAERLPADLSIDRFDAMLIYDQVSASRDDIDRLATTFGAALTGFVRAGGVLVILDGGTAGTYRLANATGLISIAGSSTMDEDLSILRLPVDALAAGVSLAYRAAPASARFETASADGVFVSAGQPVVLHHAVIP